MPYTVFVSHSTGPKDLPLVQTFAHQLSRHGIDCYLAERDWKFGNSLEQKIENAIQRCDCVVAFLTVGGSASSYVNQEIGIALGKSKAYIPIVEKGVDLRGLPFSDGYVEIDHESPADCLSTLAAYMANLNTGAAPNAAIFWAAITFIASVGGKR